VLIRKALRLGIPLTHGIHPDAAMTMFDKNE